MDQITHTSISGIVFNIQKFSLNDGPGIRTVVFLKGCPLHCLWCSNPESQITNMQILWDSKSCLHCHRCTTICPTRAVKLISDTSENIEASKNAGHSERIRIDHTLCNACGLCIQECPVKALTAEGERKTVAEVMKIVMQDEVFYEESGGGLTLSGGEALAQPEFAAALLRAAKEKGLDTALETTGFASPEIFDRVTEHADHLLFDLKHWDEEEHIRWTGVSNKYPLLNMKHAMEKGQDVLPRIPVIPGVNASLSNVDGFVLRLREVGAARCQLLPFHQFGENKYAQLGREYAFTDVKALRREDLEPYRQRFLEAGIEAFF